MQMVLIFLIILGNIYNIRFYSEIVKKYFIISCTLYCYVYDFENIFF